VLDNVTWFRQSAMRLRTDDLVVYIDPWGTSEDDEPGDVILLTHAHDDHFQPGEIDHLRKGSTKVAAPHDVANELSGAVTAVAPGQSHELGGVRFQTVPAYNAVEHRLDKHPKANGWVGYVLTLAGSTYYHSGDTDALPELEAITTDVAMVCIGGDPFTMGPPEAGGLVRAMKPRLAVPMHYGFIVGSPAFATEFRREADPILVEELRPTNDFEIDQTG
jgi:L-ascorbate metabolism protein UlaG (beta-lactamase superfamily)